MMPRRTGLRIVGLILLISACVGGLPWGLRAAEVMPPAPTRYFNDFAGVTPPDAQARLNQSLEQFEKDTSSQIVVAVFPKMQSDSSVEDYVNRIFKAWKIGQAQKNNGVLLAVFVEDRKMRIEVGYGLEGAIPDVIAKRIIENELKPRFRNNDFAGGLSAGVQALMQAARGEYQGTGGTVGQQIGNFASRSPLLFVLLGVGVMVIFFFGVIPFLSSLFGYRGTTYSGRGRSSWGGWPVVTTSSWSGGDSGGWSGGGDSGGGFSGGGGDSGGGGASGSW